MISTLMEISQRRKDTLAWLVAKHVKNPNLYLQETTEKLGKGKFFAKPPVKRTEPLVGWRGWKIRQIDWGMDGDEKLLCSQAANYAWTGPVATTKLQPDGSPTRVHSENPIVITPLGTHLDYGIYSYKTPYELSTYHGFGDIVGRIDNLGHVVEHEWGYRAQKAAIIELWFLNPGLYYELKTPFEDRYQCPVNLLKIGMVTPWKDYWTQEMKEAFKKEGRDV